MQRWKKIREEGQLGSIIWDVVMILIAVSNLTLISFDLMYLRLRPYLYYYAPELVQNYDQLKGIEENPFTTDYLHRVNELEASIFSDLENRNALSEETLQQSDELARLSSQMLRDNPFQTAGLSKNLEKIKGRIRQFVTNETSQEIESYREAFQYFWKLDSQNYRARLDYFDQEIAPLMEINYFRHRDIDGDFVNLFWSTIDLPFLIFFASDFLVRFLLFFRKVPARWFLFLVYNWYDFLSLFPSSWLRLLRLFRVMAIWARLQQSELLASGDGLVLRTIKSYTDLLSREISGMVAIQIISQLQTEVQKDREGQFLADSLEPHRDEIKDVVLEQTEKLTRERILPFRPRVAALVQVSLEKSLDSSAFRFVPNAILRPVLQRAGNDVVDSLFETIAATVESQEGKEAIGGIVDQMLDSLRGTDGEKTAGLIQKLTYNSLEELKGQFVNRELLAEGSKTLQQQLSEITASMFGGKRHASSISPESINRDSKSNND
ncbi:MAG TPA: hypothetical protein DEA96_15055 [Leptospiraceae bacterium]|nr:hypothetical protein [Spirochaetaceae bacterium]HBS06285.1 hypothetical protein [Leptospiraceae bacterium]|tara:strand:+ start:32175 stop:33653 length:1479 start_codon:yes stop_codon:yes gene_type:complete